MMIIMKGSVKTNLFWILMVCCYQLTLANGITQTYIHQYKSIAINEMNEFGIPASIKMAQAILESSSGTSSLAKESNNHFGIKCGSGWVGPKAYREDDDYDNGLLVKSCFRAYDDPSQSFRAHSNFLSNPNSKRYKFLFDLDRYDYKSWAQGLRKAGYATDPNYPSKLINLIEKYELYLLDFGIIEDVQEPLAVTTESDKMQEHPSRDKKSEISEKGPIVIASVSSYPADSRSFYTMRDGDNMTAVAKKFKMSVKELFFRNRMAYGSRPQIGQRLAIDHYIHFKPLPKTTTEILDGEVEDEYLWEQTISVGR